jgi:hypothetical protein
MARSSNNRPVISSPPGRSTRFPIFANSQWPGIFSSDAELRGVAWTTEVVD